MRITQGFAHIAVMPLQVLVNFFAPRSCAASKNTAARTDIFWARDRFNPADRAAPSRPTPSRSATVTRITRTGFSLPAPIQAGLSSQRARPTHTPVRLRRAIEASASSQLAGRMFISGRMRDVCEELNRLSA
jgi:hypothetical protein